MLFSYPKLGRRDCVADKFGLKIGIEGEKEFKNSLRDINQSFKVLGSEMKLVSSAFDKNDKSVRAISSRNEVLNKSIETQKDKVKLLEEALKNSSESFGENDKRTKNWEIQLNNAKATLNGMERELQDNEKALDDLVNEQTDVANITDKLGDELKETGDEADKSGGKFEKLGGVLKGIGVAMGAVAVAAGAAAIKLGKEVVSAYADYEQLVGGVDTLFKDASNTVDFLTKKRVKNNGIVPQYYVENSHEPIIPKTLFLQVQEELTRRANLKNKKGSITYSSKYALSGITCCGKCGEIYRRLHWNNRGKKSIVWRCYSRLDKTKDCDARTVLEKNLKQAVVDGINRVFADEGRIKGILNSSIQKLLIMENVVEVENIDSQMQVLQQQLLEQSSKNQDVTNIGEQIIQLKEQKQNILLGKAVDDNLAQRMDEMLEFIDQNGHGGLEYDEVLARRLVEKVIIYDDCINIKFKSEIEIEVQS